MDDYIEAIADMLFMFINTAVQHDPAMGRSLLALIRSVDRMHEQSKITMNPELASMLNRAEVAITCHITDTDPDGEQLLRGIKPTQ